MRFCKDEGIELQYELIVRKTCSTSCPPKGNICKWPSLRASVNVRPVECGGTVSVGRSGQVSAIAHVENLR